MKTTPSSQPLPKLLPAVVLGCVLAVLQPGRVGADTFGWSGSGSGPGSGANTAWLTPGNWTNNVLPGAADIVFFGSAGSGTSIGFNFNGPPAASTNLGAIVLGGGSTVNRTIGNSSTTAGIATRLYLNGVGGGLITNSESARTLTLAPFAGGSAVAMTNVLVNSGVIEAVGPVVISANIIEAGGARTITKAGPGTLTLSGTNAYTGKTIVLAGTLIIPDENRLGNNPASASADTLTLNGGILQASASFTIDDGNRGITLGANNGTFNNNGNTITVSRPITGPGNLTNTGGGTVILNRTDNTYSGRTVLRGGMTRAINGNSFGALPGAYVADQIILDGGGLMNQDSEFTLEANRGITVAAGGGRLQAGFARSWAVNSIIAGPGLLTIANDVTPAVIYLNGANTFSGDMIVNNNTGGGSWALVAVNGSLAPGGLVRVTTNGWLLGAGVINRNVAATNGATINAGNLGAAGTLTVNGSLNLTNSILSLDLAGVTTVGGDVNDLLQVNGDLNLAGAVIVRPSALNGLLAAGTYRLINYTGALTGSAANLVADADGYTVTFDTSTAGEVNMTVSGSPTTVVWKGTAGPLNAPAWDVATTPNWAVGGTPSTFLQGQNALFDDTGFYGIGLVPVTIGMVGPSANYNSLLPASVTVDTTNNVTLNNTAGQSGKLSGPMTLTKRGAGTLTLATANGNFPNDYTGPSVIENGIVKPGYTRAFGATNAPTVVSATGTLDINGQNLGAEPFVASGSGFNGQGAIINSGGAQQNALRLLTLAGDATIGGVNRWDVRNYANNNSWPFGVAGGGYSLIKTGANQITFVNIGDTDLGDILVQQGILSFEVNSLLGRTTDEATVMPGASLMFWGSSVFNQKPFRFHNNARLFKDNGTTTNDGPITLLGGTAIVDIANNSGNIYQVRNVVDGPGGLAKIGAGILQLAGTNTYSGPTVVSNGTLSLLTNGSRHR